MSSCYFTCNTEDLQIDTVNIVDRESQCFFLLITIITTWDREAQIKTARTTSYHIKNNARETNLTYVHKSKKN